MKTEEIPVIPFESAMDEVATELVTVYGPDQAKETFQKILKFHLGQFVTEIKKQQPDLDPKTLTLLTMTFNDAVHAGFVEGYRAKGSVVKRLVENAIGAVEDLTAREILRKANNEKSTSQTVMH